MFYDKYKALAYQSPLGVLLDAKAKQQWDSWEDLIARNHIFTVFKRYGYSGTLKSCAEDIYTAAIWGYGVSGWIEGQNGPERFCIANFFSGRTDSYLKRFRGMNGTPLWFYLLDQWLESLCRDLCNDILSLSQKNADC